MKIHTTHSQKRIGKQARTEYIYKVRAMNILCIYCVILIWRDDSTIDTWDLFFFLFYGCACLHFTHSTENLVPAPSPPAAVAITTIGAVVDGTCNKWFVIPVFYMCSMFVLCRLFPCGYRCSSIIIVYKGKYTMCTRKTVPIPTISNNNIYIWSSTRYTCPVQYNKQHMAAMQQIDESNVYSISYTLQYTVYNINYIFDICRQ